MRYWTPLPLLLVLCACVGRGPCRSPTPPGGPVREVWVDAAGRPDGDGTRQRPLATLDAALALPGLLRVHVARGRYPGPFTLPEGVRVEGEGPATVLFTDGESPVLLAPSAGPGRPDSPARNAAPGPGPQPPEQPARNAAPVSDAAAPHRSEATLTDLEVRGGSWGLDLREGRTVRLERVRIGGQRQGAVSVASGRLDAEDASFEATGSEVAAVLVQSVPSTTPAEAHLRNARFTGPYRRAVRVQGPTATARLDTATFNGPTTAVGVDAGEASVRRATAEGGRGAAFSVVEGTLSLQDVRVLGHEYGVSAMRARRITVRDFTSIRAERAGMGLALSREVLLEDLSLQGSGNYGALQLTNTEAEVRRFRLDAADSYGLVAVGGRLVLRDGTITRVHSKEGDTGDGLHLRQVEADIEGLEVRQTSGSCVLAAQAASVRLRDARLADCGQAALTVDTLATLDARGVDVRGGGAALAAFNEGRLSVDVLSTRDLGAGLATAGCQGRTRITLGRVRSTDSRGLSEPCVDRTAPASP